MGGIQEITLIFPQGERRAVCTAYYERAVKLEHQKYDLELTTAIREHKVSCTVMHGTVAALLVFQQTISTHIFVKHS